LLTYLADGNVEATEINNIGSIHTDEMCHGVDNQFGMEENFMDEYLDLDKFKECW
jgi:hypothetical protein